MNDRKKYLTPKQVANRLGVSVQTVYRAIWSGELTASHIGPRILRISASDFEQFATKSTVSDAAER